MNKEPGFNFLQNNRNINKGKTGMKNVLNINCLKNKQKMNAKKIKNFPFDKFLSTKNASFKKINEQNISNKDKTKEKIQKFFSKKRNLSYVPNINTNNCTINNNINYSNNNNINFNMINNNININNNKILTKQNSKCDINKNKIRKKMILSDISSHLYNSNITSLNNEISKIAGENNISSYFDINNKNLLFEKQSKNASNKNQKNTDIDNNKYNNYLSNKNSYHHDPLKKSEENKSKTKIIFINYQNFRRNNRLHNNSHTQTQNNLYFYKPHQNRRYPKRKYNNSQSNIIMNNMKKSFYTTYLYNGLWNSKNDIQKSLKYNSNNSTIVKGSQNKKYFNLSKENSILNLTGSFNSQKHLFNDGINFIFENNDNDKSKIIKKNKSSFLENYIKPYSKNITSSGDIHLRSIKDLISNKFNQELNSIQIDLEQNLIKEDKDKDKDKELHNHSSKKFKILKNSFESFLKLLNQTLYKNTFNIVIKYLQKIYFGYNDIFTSFSIENQKLKKINDNFNEQKAKIEKKYRELGKIIQEKQVKLKSLEEKFFTLLNYVNNNNNLNNKEFCLKTKSFEDGEIISTIEDIDQDVKNGKIYKFNKNNLDDLDALYFFDKIKMEPQRSYSEIGIPNLKINERHKNDKKRRIEEMPKNNGIINISDIKFTSNYFNKFKKALEKD